MKEKLLNKVWVQQVAEKNQRIKLDQNPVSMWIDFKSAVVFSTD